MSDKWNDYGIAFVFGLMHALLMLNVLEEKYQCYFLPYHLKARQTVSKSDEIEIETMLLTDCDWKTLEHQSISIGVSNCHQTRYFHGVIVDIELWLDSDQTPFCRLHIKPTPSTWNTPAYFQTYLDLSIVDITKKVFLERQFNDFDFSGLKKSYPPLDYFVQHVETDWKFLQRAWHAFGIQYAFKHEKNRCVLCLFDSLMALSKPIDSKLLMNVNYSAHLNEQPSEASLDSIIEQVTGEASSLELRVTDQIKLNHQRYSIEALSWEARDVTHFQRLPSAIREAANTASRLSVESIGVSFVAKKVLAQQNLPASMPQYKRSKRTAGLMLGTIADSNGQTAATDSHGRVQIHFDLQNYPNPSDQPFRVKSATSAWVPVASPWQGEQHEFYATPIAGHRVVLSYLEGDANRPIIVGELPADTDEPVSAETMHREKMDAKKTTVEQTPPSLKKKIGFSVADHHIIFDDGENEKSLQIKTTGSLQNTANNISMESRESIAFSIQGKDSSMQLDGRHVMVDADEICLQAGDSYILLKDDQLAVESERVFVECTDV